MHNDVLHSPLGKSSEYRDHYSPELLYPIPRAPKWAELGLDSAALPFAGVDVWTCYELSWLLPSGKPVVAIAEFSIAADSPNIIESKSFKLYLNSLNQTVYADAEQVREVLQRDLSAAAGKPVHVQLYGLNSAPLPQPLQGVCLDDLDVPLSQYQLDAGLLKLDEAGHSVVEHLYSHLLKSNCPVTGQPDWGSVVINYRGPQLDHASVLAYLVSFRQHADFHEQCVERIFCDLRALLGEAAELTVYARYVRRGGLDINPYRSTSSAAPVWSRLARQ